MHVHVRRATELDANALLDNNNMKKNERKRIEINALFPAIIMSCWHIDADYLFFCSILTRKSGSAAYSLENGNIFGC